MLRIMAILHRNNFDGVLIPDHTPQMTCSAPWHAGMAHTLGFMLAAMAQDYYPRVSALADHPDQLADVVNQQHRLIMLVAAPIILVAVAVTPYFVPIIYSKKFYPTVDLLEWQLIGDIFKFSSSRAV